jgi:hypothetical protein
MQIKLGLDSILGRTIILPGKCIRNLENMILLKIIKNGIKMVVIKTDQAYKD